MFNKFCANQPSISISISSLSGVVFTIAGSDSAFHVPGLGCLNSRSAILIYEEVTSNSCPSFHLEPVLSGFRLLV